MLAPLLFLLPLSTVATMADAPPYETRPYQALHLEVVHTPPVARIGGKDRLVYELHATNFSPRPVTVKAIAIVDAASGSVLAQVDPVAAMRIVGADGDDPTQIASGQRAIFYFDLNWEGRGLAPIMHRLSFEAARQDAPADHIAVVGGSLSPRPRVGAELGAPLRGGPWVAVALPGHNNGHRRYPYAVSGRVKLPGRHAIDWMPARGFDPASAGSDVAPDGSDADVLAVADGVIVTVKEPRAPGDRPSVEDETGAMIVLKLPDGRFAFYQHLAPDLAVKVGARVRKGQVIARLGASGHVSRPHLHFHVADGEAPLDSEGLPYRLGAGRIVGRYADHNDFSTGTNWLSAPPRRIDGMPVPDAVVRFLPAAKAN